MLHFQIQGALVFRQLNPTGYIVLTKDLSYKEKESLSLHSQAMNQQKDTIKELKLRVESSVSSKSHELTGHVWAKQPGRWQIPHHFELTLAA